jgi:hypothetical protein
MSGVVPKEEILLDKTGKTQYVDWRVGEVGKIYPELVHRISKIRNGRVSYSLWIRGPKRVNTKLHGSGWNKGMTHGL